MRAKVACAFGGVFGSRRADTGNPACPGLLRWECAAHGRRPEAEGRPAGLKGVQRRPCYGRRGAKTVVEEGRSAPGRPDDWAFQRSAWLKAMLSAA